MELLKKDISLSIVFCPMSKVCSVYRTWQLLQNIEFIDYYKILIDRWFSNFIEAFENKFQRKDLPKNKFVFAHGKPEYLGFKSMTELPITSTWWTSEEIPSYDIGIFHACKGSLVLSDSKWDLVFKDWVSYKDDLPIVFGIPTDKRWKNIFISMIDITNKLKNGIQIKIEIEKLYQKELIHLNNESPGNGSKLMILHIARAINCIKTKN